MNSYLKTIISDSFVFRIVVFISLLVFLDVTFGKILKYFYFKQQTGSMSITTYAIDQVNTDILIFGPSRANHHYIPDIFSDRLHLSCYNVGRDGNSIFYHYGVLQCVLKRYIPKIIILDISFYEFQKLPNTYDRISSLLPYYEDHQEIRPIVALKSPFEKVKILSSLYPYNSLMLRIGGGILENSKKLHDTENVNRYIPQNIKGYIPLYKVWDEPLEIDTTMYQYQADGNMFGYYEKFIAACQRAKVKLYVVCSPYFIKFPKTDYSILLGSKIAKKYNAQFFNFSQDTLYLMNRSLFYDPMHLNDKGARVFTNSIIDLIIKQEQSQK